MKSIPLNASLMPARLNSALNLGAPRPFRVAFPILLDGDQLVTSPEHLGVGYLVSVLRHAGAHCRVIEVPAGVPDEPSIDEIVHWRPDVVGISLTTVSSAHATAFGAELRNKLPSSVFVLAGGPLASYRGAELMDLPGWQFLDGLIRGEGELPMLRLAEALHGSTDLSKVPNLAYRQANGAVRQNPMSAAVHDLDEIPFPARDQFEHQGGSPSPRFKFLRLSTSRGCTSFCTFCNAPHARNRIAPGAVWRGCSPTRVVDEIEQLYEKYGCQSYAFVDSTFEDPGGTSRAKARLAAIAQEILDRGLHVYFGVCMQARNWTDRDRDLLDLLWRAGLEYVLVGIEAGTDADLKLWRKRSTVADNYRIIEMLRATNIYVQYGFIAFHPYTTFATLRESCEFLHRSKMGHNFKKFIDRLELYAGAEIVETLRTDGLLLESFDRNCDEFGYRFRDDRIDRLVTTMHELFGPGYEQHYSAPRALYKFEADDSALHIFLSRLIRKFGHSASANEILDAAKTEMDGIRERLADFNYELVCGYIDLAESDRLDSEEITASSTALTSFVLSRVRELRGVQLKAAVQMNRAGFALQSAGIESLT